MKDRVIREYGFFVGVRNGCSLYGARTGRKNTIPLNRLSTYRPPGE